MALAPGSRVGPYEVIAPIGEGGMGKVWRARHTALKRDDALKVLPDAFATDPDRLARFQREAQVLASLNHPNIAHVYGLEEVPSAGPGQAAVKALVMELVEGPTLAEIVAGSRLSAMGSGQSLRPAEGPGPRAQSRHALPLDEALSSGGAAPFWRRDGRELFYEGLDERIMAVPIDLSATTVKPGTPVELFQGYGGLWPSPDGQRFLIAEETEPPAPITLLLNWAGVPR